MPDHAETFEELRSSIVGLAPAEQDGARDVVWADDHRAVGVSRDPEGRLEVFITGDELEPRDRLVRDHLRHHVWQTRSGEPISANRLVLPVGAHFDGVAAFICAELERCGAVVDSARAFAESESVIALALRRSGLSDQALTGLVGELVLLAALVTSTSDPAHVVEAWAGAAPSSRDFQLGSVGVEVKTTTGTESEHHVQGFHQIELGHSVGGVPETNLYLLSLGITWVAGQTPYSRTMPSIVDHVLGHLESKDAQASFLSRLNQYGGDAALGYDHAQHRHVPRFERPLQTSFERLYDLTDDRLKLLRSSDVNHAVHVDASSVTFRLRLPRRVRGELNPVTGLSTIARTILDGAS